MSEANCHAKLRQSWLVHYNVTVLITELRSHCSMLDEECGTTAMRL